jgi:negative regulator of sigma E activity
MKHLSEEELIEHHYGETNARVGRHLERCEECARVYAALAGDLAGLEAPEPPARDAWYGEQVWRSLASSLPAYAVRRRSWLQVGRSKAVGYAAACVLLVVGAFLAGRQYERRESPMTATNNGVQTRQQVVRVVLGDHLDRAERLLVELKHADASNNDLALPMREEARNLLAANRVCRQSLTQIGDPALATPLDHLGRVFAELANEPGGLSSSTIIRLQNEMNTEDLLFEIRVLRSRVPDLPPGGAVESNGGTI